jgi:predicted RNase H-like HicB family nuclease
MIRGAKVFLEGNSPEWRHSQLFADRFRRRARNLSMTRDRHTARKLLINPDRVPPPLSQHVASMPLKPAKQLSSLDHAPDYPNSSEGGTLGRAMRERISLTLDLEEVDNGWIQVRVEEFPEVVTVGRDDREARLMALDAVREYLASFEPGEPIPHAIEGAWVLG